MKLSDIDIDQLHAALRSERSAWIRVAAEEGRRHTESEKITLWVLSALEGVVRRIVESGGGSDVR